MNIQVKLTDCVYMENMKQGKHIKLLGRLQRGKAPKIKSQF